MREEINWEEARQCFDVVKERLSQIERNMPTENQDEYNTYMKLFILREMLSRIINAHLYFGTGDFITDPYAIQVVTVVQASFGILPIVIPSESEPQVHTSFFSWMIYSVANALAGAFAFFSSNISLPDQASGNEVNETDEEYVGQGSSMYAYISSGHNSMFG